MGDCASPWSLVVVGGTIGTLIKGTYAADQWFDFFMFGLTIGGVYALIALGYTMVYGVLRLINFAHGDITMTGAFSAFFLARSFDRAGFLDNYPILVDVGDHAAVDGGVHRDGADRRADLLPAVPPCRVARAADLRDRRLLRAPAHVPRHVRHQCPLLSRSRMDEGRDRHSSASTSRSSSRSSSSPRSSAMLFLYVVVQKTKMGMAMRAVSEDRDAAALMGIDSATR